MPPLPVPRARRRRRRLDLRSARKRARLTQMQLAKLAGVNQGLISKLETGGSGDPNISTVWRLARALDLDPGDLLFVRDGGP